MLFGIYDIQFVTNDTTNMQDIYYEYYKKCST